MQNREIESEKPEVKLTSEVNFCLDKTGYPCYHRFTSKVNPKER